MEFSPAGYGLGVTHEKVAGGGTGALLLLALTVMNGVAMSIVFSPLQEAVRSELKLGDLQMSLLTGLAAAVPILLLSVPVGRLTDRSNRVRLLVSIEVVATLGALITVFADTFAVLFAGRVLTSVGLVCGLPVATAIAADFSPRERRGRAIVLLVLGRTAGSALAFALGGWLFGLLQADPTGSGPVGGLQPWRAVILVFALGSVAVIAALLLLLREPARRELGAAVGAPLRPALRSLWALRRFLVPLFLGEVSVLMADTAASIWAAPVLTRSYGWTPQQFAAPMGLVVLLTGALGAVVGGCVVDWGQRSGNPRRFLVGAVAACITGVPAGLFAASPTPTIFFALLFVLLLCGAIAALATTTAITVFVPNELRGLCLGLLIVCTGVAAFGVAPTLVSLISKALGGPEHIGQALAVTSVSAGLISCAGFLVAMKRTPALPGTPLDTTLD